YTSSQPFLTTDSPLILCHVANSPHLHPLNDPTHYPHNYLQQLPPNYPPTTPTPCRQSRKSDLFVQEPRVMKTMGTFAGASTSASSRTRLVLVRSIVRGGMLSSAGWSARVFPATSTLLRPSARPFRR